MTRLDPDSYIMPHKNITLGNVEHYTWNFCNVLCILLYRIFVTHLTVIGSHNTRLWILLASLANFLEIFLENPNKTQTVYSLFCIEIIRMPLFDSRYGLRLYHHLHDQYGLLSMIMLITYSATATFYQAGLFSCLCFAKL